MNAEVVVASLQTDAVRLLAECFADKLELARVLVDEAGEDDVVCRHGIDLAVAQRLEAFRIGTCGHQFGLGVLGPDPLGRGRPLGGADLLAGQVIRAR